MKYRKKPVVIDAHKYTTIDALRAWLHTLPGTKRFKVESGAVIIPTLGGEKTASPGDWIIKGVMGELYPCKPEIFGATYEPVDVNEAP